MTTSRNNSMTTYPQQAILEAYQEARTRMPNFSIHTLAKTMQLSHGHVQAARLGSGVIGLALTPCDMVMRLPSLGALEISTVSSHAHMLSKTEQLQIAGQDSNNLSLRMLLPHWYWACLSHDEQHKIEIFDRYGRLLHSISSSPESPLGKGWQRLEKLAIDRPPAFTELVDVVHESTAPKKQGFDALVAGWRSLTNESDVSHLLKRHHLRRVDAYKALENRFTQRMSSRCFVSTLERAARASSPIRLRVANAGAVHQHSGLFGQVGERHQKIEIAGEKAMLAIDREAIAETWLVTLPCKEGVTTRLEAFSKDGRFISGLSEAIHQPMPVSTMNAMSVYG